MTLGYPGVMYSNGFVVFCFRQVNARGWTTYTDLLVLSRNLQMEKLWRLLAECTFKVSISLQMVLYSWDPDAGH